MKTRLMLVVAASLLGVALGIDAERTVNAREPSSAGPEFVGNQTCKLCHNKTDFGTQWEIWKGSPHSRAYEILFSEQSARITEERGITEKPWESTQCLRCHVTAYDAVARTTPPMIYIEDGVQCESCHGPGSLHVADGRRFWMQRDTTVDTGAHIRRPDARVCTECHRPASPTWDPRRYTLPGGRTTGFDFQQAFAKIAHPMLKSFADDFPAAAR